MMNCALRQSYTRFLDALLREHLGFLCAKPFNHRLVQWFGLEGTFRGHLVQPHCHEQGHLQPDQVAQSPVQPDLECFQGWTWELDF